MERKRVLNPVLSLVVVGLSVQLCTLPRLAPTSVSGMAWVDANADGIRDMGELGMAGVKVALVAAADSSVTAQATTDDSGGYAFSSVEQHAYRVAFTLPNGYGFSPKDQGQDDSLDSDVNPGGAFPGQTDSFVPGEKSQTGWDAGLVISLPSPTPLPATPETVPSTPLPTSAPVTQVAGDYSVQYLVAIDNGDNASVVSLPANGTMHVSQDGQSLSIEIEGMDPNQTRITFNSTLDTLGTTTGHASSTVAGIQDVNSQIAGGFLRVASGEIQVSFTLEVGVDGELPGGQEVVYSVVSE